MKMMEVNASAEPGLEGHLEKGDSLEAVPVKVFGKTVYFNRTIFLVSVKVPAVSL